MAKLFIQLNQFLEEVAADSQSAQPFIRHNKIEQNIPTRLDIVMGR